jgi:hypothetical protein
MTMHLVTLLLVIIVSVQLSWNDTNTIEDGTIIYREIAGTFEQVGQVGPDVITFSESFSAVEGSKACYTVKTFRGEETAYAVNPPEWCGDIPTAPPPCKQKGKSRNCH